MPAPDLTLLQTVAGVIGAQFRVDPATIHAGTSALDVPGWDSLSHTILLMHLEKTFNVRIGTQAGFNAATVGELANEIARMTRAGGGRP